MYEGRTEKEEWDACTRGEKGREAIAGLAEKEVGGCKTDGGGIARRGETENRERKGCRVRVDKAKG